MQDHLQSLRDATHKHPGGRLGALLVLCVCIGLVAPSCDPAPTSPVTFLAGGFRADVWIEDDDGAPELLFLAQKSGTIWVFDFEEGRVLPQPFATLAVSNAGEAGLLSIALSPDFDDDGFVYVLAIVPSPLRGQVIRYRDNGAGLGLNPTVLVDNLPAAFFRNGGRLAVSPDGTLLIGLGDMGEASRAQAEGDLAGRVLRYHVDGSLPLDNPFAGSPEYARGFRDPQGLAIWQPTGGVFLAERGDVVDEINSLKLGKNYGTSIPGGSSAPDVGQRVTTFPAGGGLVALAFHPGTNVPPGYSGNLFAAFQFDRSVRRVLLSGSLNTTFVAVEPFLTFRDEAPLDLLVLPTGSILVATTRAVYRIARQVTVAQP